MGMGKALLFVPWTWLAFPLFPVPEFFHTFGERAGEKGQKRKFLYNRVLITFKGVGASPFIPIGETPTPSFLANDEPAVGFLLLVRVLQLYRD
jgi:hypothetical protein